MNPTPPAPPAAAAALAFEREFGRPPQWLACAPGRVNLIGEHTDYNEGFVLPMAVDRFVAVAGAASAQRPSRLHAATLSGVTRAIDPTRPSPDGSFADYAVGVLRELEARDISVPPFDAATASDLPAGSGLSSSAALDVALALLFLRLAGASLPPLEIAALAQAAENRFVGVRCGIMDPYVIALGEEGHALEIDCRTLRHQPVPVDLPGLRWLVIHTGVPRELLRSAYNDRRLECDRALSLLRARHPHARALRDVRGAWLAELASAIGEEVALRRARHVIEENERVAAAVEALRRRDVPALATLFAASHRSLRDLYEVSSPELDRLVDSLLEAGAAAARMTGAGFGGCVVALVDEARADAIAEDAMRRHREATRRSPLALIVRAVAGARVLRPSAGSSADR
jgi:galactokinase